jgi:hypothetical protein
MGIIKGEDPKMESQRAILVAAQDSGDEILPHGIGKEGQTVTYQTVKDYTLVSNWCRSHSGMGKM